MPEWMERDSALAMASTNSAEPSFSKEARFEGRSSKNYGCDKTLR